MVKGPPYVDGLPYLKRSLERWCPDNRPTWSNNDIKWTAETLWFGEVIMRDEYRRKIGKKKIYPMYRPDLIPVNPWNQRDAILAKTNRTLPPARGVIPAAPPIPPGFVPMMAHPVPPNPPVPSPPPNQPSPPPPPPPAHPRDIFPFDFWPNLPWDAEPENDPTKNETVDTIDEEEEVQLLWRATRPMMWPLRNEEDWENKSYLGAGSFGCTGLWCQYDETDTIIRQMVVKECRPSRTTWRDPVSWRNQLPREINTHQLVDQRRAAASGGTDHDTLIEHHGYRLMMEQQRYRIFLSYYEGKDLDTVVSDHFKETLESLNRGDPELPELLPEGLIWRIASSLVTACQIMHYGQVSQGGVQHTTPGWRPITHGDIKLDNIFVKPAEQEGEFPAFVLSDFGESFTNFVSLNDDMDGNPEDYAYGISAKARPPERQDLQAIDGSNEYYRIDQKTDVWFIGKVMYDLMQNAETEGPRRYEPNSEFQTVFCAGAEYPHRNLSHTVPGGWFRPVEQFRTFVQYPAEMKDLAAACLTWRSTNRPALIDLRRRIDGYLAANPHVANDRSMGPIEIRAEANFRVGDTFNQVRPQ